MRDWSLIVRAHLTGLDLESGREQEIYGEIAGHLEDVYQQALRAGCSDDAAATQALATVSDWKDLARSLSRAERGERMVSDDAKMVLLPGVVSMVAATLMSFGVIPLLPPTWWASVQTSMHVAVSALLVGPYVACGALAAWWSRRAGATIQQRLLASVFPLSLNVAVVTAAMGLERRFHSNQFPKLQLGVILVFVVVPAVALAIGALPFLRNPAMSAER